MIHVIHTKMGEGRRVAIPAEMCHEYGMEPGTALVLEPTKAGIVVRPFQEVIHEVQAFFAELAPPGIRLSDSVIDDRRREAAEEERG